MSLNYIMIPDNVTRRPRLGHRHEASKASSPISRAGRRAPGKANGETTAPVKNKTYWNSFTARIGAFFKGVNKYVYPKTEATVSAEPKDLFNTESLLGKISKKSAFHRHLLHPDDEAPVVPSRPDWFYPPSPKTPTVVPRRVPRTKVARSAENVLRFDTKLAFDRNYSADCVGKVEVSAPGPGISHDNIGRPMSTPFSTSLSHARQPIRSSRIGTTVGDNNRLSFSPQDASILGQHLRPTSSALGGTRSLNASRRSAKAGDNNTFVFSPQASSIPGQHLRPRFAQDKGGSSRSSTPTGGTPFAFLPQSASILGQRLRPISTNSPASSDFSPQDTSILGQRLPRDAPRSSSRSFSPSGGVSSRCAAFSNKETLGNGSSSPAPRRGSSFEQVLPSGFSGTRSNSYEPGSVSSRSSSRHGTPRETFSPVNVGSKHASISGEYHSLLNDGTVKRHRADTYQHRNGSVHRQPVFFSNANEPHINQRPRCHPITPPQFFDYDSRLQPSFPIDEYTPHEPYFNHHIPIHQEFVKQDIHPKYSHQAPQYPHVSSFNHFSPLEYSPRQPYF